jgi:Zn/Cd-binding protein ZinT
MKSGRDYTKLHGKAPFSPAWKAELDEIMAGKKILRKKSQNVRFFFEAKEGSTEASEWLQKASQRLKQGSAKRCKKYFKNHQAEILAKRRLKGLSEGYKKRIRDIGIIRSMAPYHKLILGVERYETAYKSREELSQVADKLKGFKG